MRLARIPCSSARHPYWALCPPLTGVARARGGELVGELPTVKDAPVPSSMAARSPSRSARAPARDASEGSLSRRKAESGGIIPIILLAAPKRSSPPIGSATSKKPSRERAKGKSFRRDGRTEHTIEKENPKHSPIQNVMTSKRATWGIPKYYAHESSPVVNLSL